MMKRYNGYLEGDKLWAIISDSVMGGVDMQIWVHLWDEPEAEMVHIANYDSAESAEDALHEMFKNVNWR